MVDETGRVGAGAEQGAVPAAPPTPSYRALFRSRSFSALWVAQVISQSGDGILDVVLPWLVLAMTDSAGLVGLTQAAVLAPGIFVGPAAGVYADRMNRRDLAILASLYQGGITAVFTALYFLGYLTFSPLIVLVLLLYSGAEFYRAGSGAMMPSIVPRENLGVANGLFTLSTSTNQLASYTIGGIALITVGITASIAYDSLTFFGAAVVLTIVARQLGSPGELTPGPAAGERKGFWALFREGLAYVGENRLFKELMVFGVVVNFFGVGFTVVLAPYAVHQLHADAFWYAALSVGFALGLIGGTAVIGRLNFRGYVGKVLFLGVMAVGPPAILVGFVTSIPAAFALFIVMGAISGSLNLPIQVLVQTKVPRELLGRAATVLRATITMAIPIGAVSFGLLAQLTSAAVVFEVVGVSLIVVPLVLFLPFRELWRASY